MVTFSVHADRIRALAYDRRRRPSDREALLAMLERLNLLDRAVALLRRYLASGASEQAREALLSIDLAAVQLLREIDGGL